MTIVSLDLMDSRPFADGMTFGNVGSYEILSGRARFALEPGAAVNRGIPDIEMAPTDLDGLVRFETDLCILRPAEPSRGNRRLLFDFPNRGNKRALQFFNDAPHSNMPRAPQQAGNGFLMRRGYSVVWAGWQGDVLPGDDRLVLNLPAATQSGRPVCGEIRSEFIVDRPGVVCLPLSGRVQTRSHPATSLDTAGAMLTRRRYPGSDRIAVPHGDWRFERIEGGGESKPGAGDGAGVERSFIPSASNIHLRSGFQPGWIYELSYTARDPLIIELGYAAVRDLVSHLRYDDGPANPLRGTEKAYGWGRSQSGRMLRDWLYKGFNADVNGRQVFSGAMPHIAGGGRMATHRFANLVVAASRQYEDNDHPSDVFPFSYAHSTDHLTGKRDAILKRPGTDPLVIHTQTATEYWQRRGSLVHTDTQGNDLPQPPGVRVYHWSSSQHWSDPHLSAPQRGVCLNLQNVVATSMFFRAVLHSMDRWVTHGAEPPPTSVPSSADGTLVPFEAWKRQFPAIPGVMMPIEPNVLPAAHGEYAVKVPAVDADGNDVAGVRAPMVAMPLGTHTGWNLRGPGHGHGAMHDFSGSTMPFALDVDEAAATGDPRPSVIGRYGSVATYQHGVARAAARLCQEGHLLEEDLQLVARQAERWGGTRQGVAGAHMLADVPSPTAGPGPVADPGHDRG